MSEKEREINLKLDKNLYARAKYICKQKKCKLKSSPRNLIRKSILHHCNKSAQQIACDKVIKKYIYFCKMYLHKLRSARGHHLCSSTKELKNFQNGPNMKHCNFIFNHSSLIKRRKSLTLLQIPYREKRKHFRNVAVCNASSCSEVALFQSKTEASSQNKDSSRRESSGALENNLLPYMTDCHSLLKKTCDKTDIKAEQLNEMFCKEKAFKPLVDIYNEIDEIPIKIPDISISLEINGSTNKKACAASLYETAEDSLQKIYLDNKTTSHHKQSLTSTRNSVEESRLIVIAMQTDKPKRTFCLSPTKDTVQYCLSGITNPVEDVASPDNKISLNRLDVFSAQLDDSNSNVSLNLDCLKENAGSAKVSTKQKIKSRYFHEKIFSTDGWPVKHEQPRIRRQRTCSCCISIPEHKQLKPHCHFTRRLKPRSMQSRLCYQRHKVPQNFKEYTYDVLQLSFLRNKLYRLLCTLFPKILPVLDCFHPESCKIDSMIDDVIRIVKNDSASETERTGIIFRRNNKLNYQQLLQSHVVLCRWPRGCLLNLRYKAWKLLKWLLPQLTFENDFDEKSDNVEYLLDLVIDSNKSH